METCWQKRVVSYKKFFVELLIEENKFLGSLWIQGHILRGPFTLSWEILVVDLDIKSQGVLETADRSAQERYLKGCQAVDYEIWECSAIAASASSMYYLYMGQSGPMGENLVIEKKVSRTPRWGRGCSYFSIKGLWVRLSLKFLDISLC